MPTPLSTTHKYASVGRELNSTFITVELALILLSIISASADSKVYPIDLVDSTSIGANGINCSSLIARNKKTINPKLFAKN